MSEHQLLKRIFIIDPKNHSQLLLIYYCQGFSCAITAPSSNSGHSRICAYFY